MPFPSLVFSLLEVIKTLVRETVLFITSFTSPSALSTFPFNKIRSERIGKNLTVLLLLLVVREAVFLPIWRL